MTSRYLKSEKLGLRKWFKRLEAHRAANDCVSGPKDDRCSAASSLIRASALSKPKSVAAGSLANLWERDNQTPSRLQRLRSSDRRLRLAIAACLESSPSPLQVMHATTFVSPSAARQSLRQTGSSCGWRPSNERRSRISICTTCDVNMRRRWPRRAHRSPTFATSSGTPTSR
jgi:hypothetical protein